MDFKAEKFSTFCFNITKGNPASSDKRGFLNVQTLKKKVTIKEVIPNNFETFY